MLIQKICRQNKILPFSNYDQTTKFQKTKTFTILTPFRPKIPSDKKHISAKRMYKYHEKKDQKLCTSTPVPLKNNPIDIKQKVKYKSN